MKLFWKRSVASCQSFALLPGFFSRRRSQSRARTAMETRPLINKRLVDFSFILTRIMQPCCGASLEFAALWFIYFLAVIWINVGMACSFDC